MLPYESAKMVDDFMSALLYGKSAKEQKEIVDTLNRYYNYIDKINEFSAWYNEEFYYNSPVPNFWEIYSMLYY